MAVWALNFGAVALRVKIEKPGHLVSFTLSFLWVYLSLASKSLEIFSREGFIDIGRGTFYYNMGDENYTLTFASSELLLLKGVTAPSNPLTLKDSWQIRRSRSFGFLYHWKITLFPKPYSPKIISVVAAIQRESWERNSACVKAEHACLNPENTTRCLLNL